MADDARKDNWDKLGILVPLIVGIAVAGVGGWFTYTSNEHQLKLNQIQALDKLRPLLVSSRPDERTFGYSAFYALGYGELAIKMIAAAKDESGRPVLVEADKSGNSSVRAQAAKALDSLNDANKKLSTPANTEPPQTAPIKKIQSLSDLHDEARDLKTTIENEATDAVEKYTKYEQDFAKSHPGSVSHVGPGGFENSLVFGAEQMRQVVIEKHKADIGALLTDIDASQIGQTDEYLLAKVKVHKDCAPQNMGRQSSCLEALQGLVTILPGGN